MIKLLIVEDDTNLSFLIKRKLMKLGDYSIETAEDGRSGLLALNNFKPDIIVTDLEMSGMDGNQMIEQIRSKSNSIPIIVLTGKIEFLKQSGANMYLKKPFEVTQLDLNIRSLLLQSGVGAAVTSYKIGSLEFDIPGRCVRNSSGGETKISPTAARVLEMLCKQMGNVVDRRTILGTIWGDPDNEYVAHNLNVQINNLRAVLKEDAGVTIENLRGTGFVLRVTEHS